MLKPTYEALGVGAGHEPVIFYLADRIKHVTATDLYGNATWSENQGAEASADILIDAQKYCPCHFNASAVTFENVNGTALPYKNDFFDFCWSLSSIEHFGGHEAAARAIREMARVTRKGGIVCVATEILLLNEFKHPEYFTRKEIEEYLINASPDLALVDGINWQLPPSEYLIDQINVLTESVHRRRRHVVLTDNDYHWTSIMLFFRKQN
jgi:ubiquinone/menaquinone biosynthesis C-methylase UbiE